MRTLALSFLAMALLAACAGTEPQAVNPQVTQLQESSDFVQATRAAVDEMLNSCGASIDKNTPLIVASLVSVDDLERSSSFGRMSAEIIANALAGRGYKVKELKLNQDRIFIRERGGEFALSRNVKEIARGHDVRFLVVGTYTMGGELKFKDYDGLLCCREAQKIYVSLRIVDAADGTIACAASYSVVTKDAKAWR
jgi:TolB-like protein